MSGVSYRTPGLSYLKCVLDLKKTDYLCHTDNANLLGTLGIGAESRGISDCPGVITHISTIRRERNLMLFAPLIIYIASLPKARVSRTKPGWTHMTLQVSCLHGHEQNTPMPNIPASNRTPLDLIILFLCLVSSSQPDVPSSVDLTTSPQLFSLFFLTASRPSPFLYPSSAALSCSVTLIYLILFLSSPPASLVAAFT